ncbi:MAG: hypothetical protein GY788_05525 [bacterium]|nr:hypothetical protein [bacterium]
MIDTTLAGNSANFGGSVYNAGALAMVDTTVAGNSAVSGGGDIFVFDTALNKNADVDTIADFRVNKDTIGLDRGIFKKVGNKLSKKEFEIGSKAGDKSDRIIYDKKKGDLLYDKTVARAVAIRCSPSWIRASSSTTRISKSTTSLGRASNARDQCAVQQHSSAQMSKMLVPEDWRCGRFNARLREDDR